jgi:hypothetical protein
MLWRFAVAVSGWWRRGVRLEIGHARRSKFNLTVNSPAQIYAFDRNKKSLG